MMEFTIKISTSYDVVAYDASWGGYGDNASRDGFTSPAAAIEYVKALPAHLKDKATAWKRVTAKVEGGASSTQIYPSQSDAGVAK